MVLLMTNYKGSYLVKDIHIKQWSKFKVIKSVKALEATLMYGIITVRTIN